MQSPSEEITGETLVKYYIHSSTYVLKYYALKFRPDRAANYAVFLYRQIVSLKLYS
jgi:hypothetical protein